MLRATIICDSQHPVHASRVTTMQVTFHRFVLAEMNTHRLFSKCVSSSRAIPTYRFIQQVLMDPAVPVSWGRNTKGMQAAEDLDNDTANAVLLEWLTASRKACDYAEFFAKQGVHKQLANRILEPWMYTTATITGTDTAYANFFALRCHKDAQPEIREIACFMLRAYHASTPRKLVEEEWHLPYVSQHERENYTTEQCILASAARCARTSYNNHDGSAADLVKDLELARRLLGQGENPAHLSPFEHQCLVRLSKSKLPNLVLESNLGDAWIQYRKTLKQDVINGIPDYAYALAGIVR